MSRTERTRKTRPLRRPKAMFAALGATALAVALGGVTAGPAGAGAPTGVETATNGLVYIYQVGTASADVDLGDLAARLDAAGFDVATRNGTAISVLGSSADASKLAGFPGARVLSSEAIDAHPVVDAAPASQDDILPSKLDGQTYETFYGGYRTVDAFHQYEDDLAAAYPDLVKVNDYGTSYTGDNPLRAVCITENAQAGCGLSPNEPKGRFLVMAQIHAREITTSEYAWRLMTLLTDSDGKDAEVTAILKNTEVWVIPDVNPDGIETVQEGIKDEGLGEDSPAWQRKNMNPGPQGCSGTWAFSQRGVDLNRNTASHWGGAGSSSDPCDQEYKGTKAASEPETTSLQDLFSDLFKDQRGPGSGDAAPATTTGSIISLHTYGQLVLLPWGWTSQHAPNDAGLRSMAFRISNFDNYTAGQDGEVLYPTSGTTEDWAYDVLGTASFTVESGADSGTCGGFLPPYSCQNALWNLDEPALLYAANASQQPYTMSLGPTTTAAKAKKAKGGKVKITGTGNDDAYGHSGVGRPAAQNVTAGRFYLGSAPWAGGTPIDMKVKGSGTSVKVQLSIARPATKTLGYVQTKDANGNWGPVKAVWVPAA